MTINKENDKKLYVKRDDLMRLLMDHIGDYSISDLGWWLETKTANNFTVIELEFMKQAFAVLDVIVANTIENVNMFKKQWNDKLKKLENRY